MGSSFLIILNYLHFIKALLIVIIQYVFIQDLSSFRERTCLIGGVLVAIVPSLSNHAFYH